jgi:hypothetical protein
MHGVKCVMKVGLISILRVRGSSRDSWLVAPAAMLIRVSQTEVHQLDLTINGADSQRHAAVRSVTALRHHLHLCSTAGVHGHRWIRGHGVVFVVV